MSSSRDLKIWTAGALSAAAVLLAIMIWRQENQRVYWSIFMVGDPHLGAQLFFGRAGCSHCHSVNGSGGNLAPDLGYLQSPQAGINQIASAMWNHAPLMWERIRKDKADYPNLRDEEIAHLFAFLYTARYVDEQGDGHNGQTLFDKKGCSRCHSVRNEGGHVGPDLSSLEGVDTPLRWSQVMWNHASAMERSIQQFRLPWPRFEGREMNDLLAYIRASSKGQRHETELLPASPERGRKVFERKSCVTCHAVQGRGGHTAPDLGTSHRSPLTIVQFAGLMWNHSPEMWRSPDARPIARPTFQGREISDLVAYLAGMRYFEPLGSGSAGQAIFVQRGCAYCHGANAEGTHNGPALRRRKTQTTAVSFAVALWQHGPKMYERTRSLGRAWPNMNESDVGDVVAFLNMPREGLH